MSEVPVRLLPMLDVLGHDGLWRVHAACRDHRDPDLWFPERGDVAEEARRICSSCPVRVDCLRSALADAEVHGLWGGVSERIRRRLRRLLLASPHPERLACPERCGCAYGVAMAEQDERMAAFARGERVPALNTLGPNVKHETPSGSCYPKGCRRPECLAKLRESRASAKERKEREAAEERGEVA